MPAAARPAVPAGAVVGLLLFVVSLPLLWWNHGRVDLGKLARTAVSATAPSRDLDEHLVAVSGSLCCAAPVGDPPYLAPGDYLAVDRVVEVWSWRETSETRSRQRSDGTTETYRADVYERVWATDPQVSAGFRQPAGHGNPSMPLVQPERRRTPRARIGQLCFIPGEPCVLPEGDQLELTPRMVRLPSAGELAGRGAAVGVRALLQPPYLFIGSGSLEQPRVGDVRISYKVVLPLPSATLIGLLVGAQVVPYQLPDGQPFYRVLRGNRAAAEAELKYEHRVLSVILDALAIGLLWLGWWLLYEPLRRSLGRLPHQGHAAAAPAALAVYLVVVLSIRVTTDAALLALLVTGLVGGVLLVLLQPWRTFRRRRAAPPPRA